MECLSETEKADLKTLRLTNPLVDETLRQLDRILASEKFARVHQKSRDFLRFVVARKLIGQKDQIKETTLAISVWHERADYDPKENTKIREAARELRRRLIAYYAREGRNDPIEVMIPTGSYVPEIKERPSTIAVALFENWNPGGDQEYLCITVSDEIAHRLAPTGLVQAKRVSRHEVEDHQFRFGLRGSLECRRDILRLNVSLDDFRARQIIFSQAFEGQRDDLLKLARKVATTILEILKLEATLSKPIHAKLQSDMQRNLSRRLKESKEPTPYANAELEA